MTEDARSLLTLLALIIGSGLVTVLVLLGIAYHCFKGERHE